ncbi:MAG TPA: Crp/Fnr family transcriptional regulator [Brachybacterium massiliense]|uniref:Crp/Fnr family transcriptional regulator n=1 Tax=Brachybacterium massiliense TaxID=1755098 RepID=A0A921SWH0_9MICO|nr:Crp/Fnr family transcriptional regulator [Brachybacterium massiliense]
MSTEQSPAGTAPQGRRTIPLTEITLPHQCPKPVRMYVLARAPYFAGLGEEVLEGIDARMSTLTFAPEERLYREGEPARALYVVAEGRIKLSQVSASGTETVTDLLVPGELFGAMSTLGRTHHHQTASALVGTCVLRIDQNDFRAVLAEQPRIALRVLDDVADRLHRAESAVGSRSTASVEQRVAATLLRLADKLGEDRGADGIMLEVPLSRADLAGLARSTPESVSRVMSRWKKDGLIDSGRRWTALLDRERLEELSTAGT